MNFLKSKMLWLLPIFCLLSCLLFADSPNDNPDGPNIPVEQPTDPETVLTCETCDNQYLTTCEHEDCEKEHKCEEHKCLQCKMMISDGSGSSSGDVRCNNYRDVENEYCDEHKNYFEKNPNVSVLPSSLTLTSKNPSRNASLKLEHKDEFTYTISSNSPSIIISPDYMSLTAIYDQTATESISVAINWVAVAKDSGKSSNGITLITIHFSHGNKLCEEESCELDELVDCEHEYCLEMQHKCNEHKCIQCEKMIDDASTSSAVQCKEHALKNSKFCLAHQDQPELDANVTLTSSAIFVSQAQLSDSAEFIFANKDKFVYEVSTSSNLVEISNDLKIISGRYNEECIGTHNITISWSAIANDYNGSVPQSGTLYLTLTISERTKPVVPEDDCENKCTECVEGSETDNECIYFSQAFGRTSWTANAPIGKLMIEEERPTNKLNSSEVLRFEYPLERQVAIIGNLVIITPVVGDKITYSGGKPIGAHASATSRVELNGTEVREIFSDLSEIIYDINSGLAVAYKTSNGVVL
ncbi:MAG: hypothetical protein ACRC37_07970, partial [Lentisphaeria bacterium]